MLSNISRDQMTGGIGYQQKTYDSVQKIDDAEDTVRERLFTYYL